MSVVDPKRVLASVDRDRDDGPCPNSDISGS